ncbi:MAG: polyprenol phosphomannose-dependent alpha 1,6 mannosyltransferase MptB [Solirubrobacterales bacterium]|nr:polyprenol phosphomannose-dependent alpha 1,6 mannosyltransferase MptB [Solirubrobacterales bacterium]
MSIAEGQLGTATQGGSALNLKPFKIRSAPTTGGLIGLGAILAGAALLCVAAATTNTLLPQTIRPVLGTPLAGPLSHIHLYLGAGAVLIAVAAVFLGYVLALRDAEQLPAKLVLGVICAFVLIVVLAPPMFSTDLFSYQAYGRMFATLGANPYVQGPQVLKLDGLYPFIGAQWVNTPTVYGPAFTLISGLFSDTASNGAIAFAAFAWKVIAALSCLGVIALMWRSARLRRVNPVPGVALFGLNPLIVLYGIGGGHNDLLMVLIAMAGIYALLAERLRTSGVAIVAAAAVKLTGGIFLPFALASHGGDTRSRRKRILLGALSAGIVTLGVSLAVFGTGILNLPFTLDQVQAEGGWVTVSGLMTMLLPWHAVSHVISLLFGVGFLAIFLTLLRRVWQGSMDWLDGAAWATFWLLLASSQLMPWYLSWLLPLVALASSRRLWRLSVWFSGWVLLSTTLSYVPHGWSLIGL